MDQASNKSALPVPMMHYTVASQCLVAGIRLFFPTHKKRQFSPFCLSGSKLLATSLLLVAYGKDKNGIDFDNVTVQSHIAM